MPKKKQNKTRRTKDSVKRINQELRAFKQKLHRMVDKCAIGWQGEPFKKGSSYQFLIPPDLVNLIIGLVMRTQQAQERDRADKVTLENARLLKAVKAGDETEGDAFGITVGEPSEPTPAPEPKPKPEPAPEGEPPEPEPAPPLSYSIYKSEPPE